MDYLDPFLRPRERDDDIFVDLLRHITQHNENLSRQYGSIASARPVPDSLVTEACNMDEKLSRSIQSDYPVPLPIPAPSRTLTAITNSFDAEAAESSIREHQRPQTFIDPGDALLVADIITAEVFEVHDFFPSVGCFGDVDESTTIADRIAAKIDSEISSFCITDPANASPSLGPTAITYRPPFQTTLLGL